MLSIQVKEGYTYTTDSQGRVASCEGSLQLGDGKRNNYAQRVVGGNDSLDDDDGVTFNCKLYLKALVIWIIYSK